MSTLAFQTHSDQNSTTANIDTTSRDSKSHFIYPSERKTQTHLRDSSHESHPSSHSTSLQWSKTTKTPRDSASEDIHLIKSPTAKNYLSSGAFLRQHQAGHPEGHHQNRLPDGLRILVTRDFDVGYFLDLSGLTHPDLIRPRLFARLGIHEDHHQNWQLFRYSGSRLKNYPLDDAQVWDLCLKAHQYLLLLVLVVVPGRINPSFKGCILLEHHAAPSNLPYQTRDSQSSASFDSSDSWPAPRSPASDTNVRSAIDNSPVSSCRATQRFNDRDQSMPSGVSYIDPPNLTKNAHIFKHRADVGVSSPLCIPGHSPAPFNYLTLSASRPERLPDSSSKFHVRQNRSTSESYALPSLAWNMREQIDTSPRPMATPITGTPPTRNSKTDFVRRDERVTLTSPDCTDDRRKSNSSISPHHSQTNHKPATKASSAIAFIQSAASKIDNVLFKPKTGDPSPSRSPLPNGLVQPISSSLSSPSHDHIKALPLPINRFPNSVPIFASPRISAPYERSSPQSRINYNNDPSNSNAQGTPWTHNMAYDEVVCSLNSSNTSGAHDMESLPQIYRRGLPDSNSLLISSHSSKEHMSMKSVEEEKHLGLTAPGTSPKHKYTPLHDPNEADTSHIGLLSETKSSKDYMYKKMNFDLPDRTQSNTPPALKLALEGNGEDLKTMTEKLWAELVKNQPRSFEAESPSDSLSCESLNLFAGDHMLEEDDEDFEPSEMFQVEMKGPQKKAVEEIKNSVAEQDEADRTPITSEVNFTGRSWAVRPPVDQVYERLEKSFPYHNIDEQIELDPLPELTEKSGLPVSPDTANFHEQEAANHSTPPAPSKIFEGGRSPSINRARSIRIVAEERKRLLSQPDINQTGDPKTNITDKQHESGGYKMCTGQRQLDDKKLGALSRIKSTGLWGIKTEEVPPLGQGRKHACDIPRSSPVHGSPRVHPSSFKWARGRLIGKGSFGEVYLALNITKGDMLAVKRVKLMTGDSLLAKESDERHGMAVAALKSEVIMLKDLEHPNIVQYLGFEETTEFASIFLEYVPGGSIGGCIRAHGAFELQVTKSFTIQTVEGLKYLHHSGILHRDLKSDNILVDLKGNCKIADFGISKVSSKVDAYQTNTCMSFKGTAFYMAPEIITNQKGYSAKADIWSLGCVVLEMMCGRRPWSEQNQLQALFKVGSEGVGPPIPGDLELDKLSQHFFQACFSRNPKDRPMADKLSYHLFLTVDPSWCFESSELFRAIGTQKIDELFNE